MVLQFERFELLHDRGEDLLAGDLQFLRECVDSNRRFGFGRCGCLLRRLRRLGVRVRRRRIAFLAGSVAPAAASASATPLSAATLLLLVLVGSERLRERLSREAEPLDVSDAASGRGAAASPGAAARDAYVSMMSESGVFAERLELEAISEVTRSQVHVYCCVDGDGEPMTASHLVELSVLAPSGSVAVADDMKNFAEQLRPLVNLDKVDPRRAGV